MGEEETRFQLSLLEALGNKDVVTRFQDIISPLITPLSQAVERNTAELASLRGLLAQRDATIKELRSDIQVLETKLDDLEQHGRRGSIRILGLPEHTPGSLDDKLLTLFNNNLKIEPALAVDDIEVAHRLGKPSAPTIPQPADAAQQSQSPIGDAADGGREQPVTTMRTIKPRQVIVKFASRRTKTTVMDARKELKDNPWSNPDGSTAKVYLVEDLTQRRAKLAYEARVLKRAKAIQDTWTFEGRIFIRDNHRHVSQINSAEDLVKYQ